MNTDDRIYTLRCGRCLRSWSSSNPADAVDEYKSRAHLRGCIKPEWHLTLMAQPEYPQLQWVIELAPRR